MRPAFLSLSMSFVGLLQMILCLRAKKKWLRLLPLSLTAGLDMVCWLVCILADSLGMEDSLGFPAVTLAFWGLFWVVSALVGWLGFRILKLIQKLFQ